MEQEQFDRSGSLMNRARELLKTSKRGIIGVHDDSGLPFYWLRKFANNEIRNPSVNRVQYLYEHLTGKPLGIN